MLPLSITYRCAKAITAQAQQWVPEIQCPDTAPEGIVRDATENDILRDAAPGDFILSRVNAPLVRLAYSLLRAGKRALIRGRSIGQELAVWLEKFGAASIPELIKCVETWRVAEIKRLEALDRPTDHIYEKAELVAELCEGRSSVGDLIAMIERLFSDATPANSILLSSTHRAKGLEAERVWVLSGTYHPERSVEERNLIYVAVTRAKKELIYV